MDVDGQASACGALLPSITRPGSALLADAAAAVALGDIRDPNLGDRLAAQRRGLGGERLFDRRRKRSSLARCRGCGARWRCSACPLSIVLAHGSEDPDRVPDFECAFNLTAQRWRERFPLPPSARQVLRDEWPTAAPTRDPDGPLADDRGAPPTLPRL